MTYQTPSNPTAPNANFRATVKKFVELHNETRIHLARQFEVSPSTVDRWWLGTATPHTLLQTQIIKWIEEHTL